MIRQIRRKVRAAQWRLHWIAFCRSTLTVSGLLCGVLALFVLISRLVPLRVTLAQVAPWAAGAGMIGVVVWTWIRRVRLREAAVRVDEALGLKERLSTALIIGAPRNEAESAVIEDAVLHARAVRPVQAFPLHLSRLLRRSGLALAALAAVWFFMPQYDLLAKAKTKKPGPVPLAVEAGKEAAAQLDALAQQLAQVEPAAKPRSVETLDRDLTALAQQIKDRKLTGEQAAAKMEKLGEKLAQRRDEIAKQLEKTASLQSRGEGRSASPIMKALQKGEFDKAAKALEDLKKQMQNGQMSPEQKKALAQELKQMAAQLGKDSKLGESLIQAAGNISQGNLNSALAGMEDAAKEMENLEGLLAELKQLEGLDHDMEGRKLALTGKPVLCESCGAMCLGGLCSSCAQKRGPWKPGESRKQGGGMGGPGIGQGSIAEMKEGATAFEKKRLKGDIAPGEIIARMKVPGRQPPGEITTRFEELRIESSQAAEDTVRGEALPLEHKALVRRYFDAIKYEKDTAADNSAAPAAKPTGTPVPAATP